MIETEAADTIFLRDIAVALGRRKWQIAATFALIFGAVCAYTFLTPKVYESRMKILVKNERADMIVSAGHGDGVGYRGEVSENEINSEIELLNSNDLLRHVVEKCGLAIPQSDSKSHPDSNSLSVERATRRLAHDLKVSPVRKSNIIEVNYLSTNPQQAAAVLRQLAQSYLEEHLKVHGTPGTYQFFSAQAGRYQSELKQAEARQEQFRQDHQIVILAQQKDAMLQKATESEAALLQADAASHEYSRRIAGTLTQLEAAAPRIMTQNRALPNQYSVERLVSMLAELHNRRTQLLVKFRSDDRLVLEAEKEITDTQTALAEAKNMTASEQATDINPVHQNLELELNREQTELNGLQARRASLAQQAKSYRSQLMALGNATAEYDGLTRTQKNAEENFLLYAKKTEEARIAESLDLQKIANVAIAEQPVEPHLPARPNVTMNLALGFLAALFVSLGGALAVEYLAYAMRSGFRPSTQTSLDNVPQERIGQGAQLEIMTGLPVLATVFVTRPAGPVGSRQVNR